MIDKPLPRSEYDKHSLELSGACAFCVSPQKLAIREFTHWTWTFAAFPYRKFHTLLVPKRHVTRLIELSSEELEEIQKIISEVEAQYIATNLVHTTSPYGDQLLYSWRSRFDDSIKESVAHLHLHVYPRFEIGTDIAVEDDAADFDMGDLRTPI